MAVKQQVKSTAKYRRPFQFNVGMIIFAIIFLYIVFSVYSYVSRDQIRYYEVQKGSIVRDQQYTGIAIRQEQAVNATSSGYVHYYIQDGRRVAVGSDVYTIDETGALQSYLKEHPELTTEMTSEQISDIRYRLSQFSQSFKNSNFSALYNTKYALDASALEYSSVANAQDLDDVLQKLGINYVRVSADQAGVVSYTIDGDEALTTDAVTADLFTMSGYKQNITKPGALMESGQPVYKLITSEKWSLVFQLDDAGKAKYQDVKSVKVHFTESDLTVNATLQVFTGKDGNSYGQLDFTELMEQFCDERFIQFDIVTNDQKGLKIPVTAVTEKDFYIVPKAFKTTGPDGSTGFYRETVAQDGSGASVEFVPTDIYRIDDQYCYLSIPDDSNTSSIRTNNILVRPEAAASGQLDSTMTYPVGPVKSLQGVYNINRGYCIFRQIVPIEQNTDYLVVAENTDYGISVYDHIVLNASLVKDGQLVYQ